MSHHFRLRLLAAIVVAMVCACADTSQRPADPMARTLADFNARLTAYLKLHRELARETGEIDETKNPNEITAREVALGAAIQKARATAQRGDIFTPEIAAVFKKIIADEYGRRSAQVKRDRKEDQDELADFIPQVNQIYPPTSPLVTFPADLLKTLPELPEELEYRLVQRYLILRDIEANLIVDVLPAATPQ